MVERLSKNGTRKLCIVFQDGGVGLHIESTYLKEKRKIFDDRGWISSTNHHNLSL